MLTFRATIQRNGKTATGIRVPNEIVSGLGMGKRPAVREQAGVAAGDEVGVAIEPDTAPREVAVPPDLAVALEGDPEARRHFDALSYSNKRRVVEPIAEAKSAETRQRRIAAAVGWLHAGRV